jgi:tetratricopeptide (TPR) repeat protein
MRLHKQQEEICRRLNDPAGLSRSICGQALILKAQGDLEGAMCLLNQQEEICRRLNDPAGLQACLGNQAVILMDQGDLDGAVRLLKQQEEICRRLNDPNGLAISLANQAHLLAFAQVRPCQALPLAEEAYRISTRHGLIALARQFEPFLDEIRKQASQ